MEAALRQHANAYKVWNLSLGTDKVCSLDAFSKLAEELDNMQEKYKVSFVISAGNYDTPPLLDFPRTGSQVQAGRITTPADSVLGITVGAVSHVDYRKTDPKQNYPSAFSRHGRWAELCDQAGSRSLRRVMLHGFLPHFRHSSVHGTGSAENLGTSFAAPIVARTLAQILSPRHANAISRAGQGPC